MNIHRKTTISVALSSALLLTVAGCSTLPDQVAELEQAKIEVSKLRQDPRASQVAGADLVEAERYLEQAQDSYDDGEDLAIIEHQAYMAKGRAELGQQRIRQAQLEQDISTEEQEQQSLQLRSRELEASQARMEAQQANTAAAAARAEANAARLVARARTAEVEKLRGELANMAEERSDGGLAIVLNGVLFETNKDTLKAGSERMLDKIAAALKEEPDRRILVEGHTDSRGEAAYNKDLSQRRAAAVRNALIERGIPASNVSAVGRGEDYPIATNDTTAGRQENRRVELLLSNSEGKFPAGTESP